MGTVRQEFEQYRAMRARMEFLQHKLREAPKVTDTVSGSSAEWPYTKQCVTVTGVDRRQVSAIRRESDGLRRRCENVEKAVRGAPNSRLRMILEMRYISGETWADVARAVPAVRGGGESTEDGVRKSAERYLDTLK